MSIRPLVKGLTVTAEAKLVDAEQMASDEQPGRLLVPKRIVVHYWPTPEGWRIWSIHIIGVAVLKSGKISMTRRSADWGPRAASYAPAWALEFADAHCPEDRAR